MSSKLLLKTYKGGHPKIHTIKETQEMPPITFDKYFLNNNNKEFNGEKLCMATSNNNNRYWVSENDKDTFFPVALGEMIYNNNNKFFAYNEEDKVIYEWDKVYMNYTRDIGSFTIRIFLKWRLPTDKHWRRLQ